MTDRPHAKVAADTWRLIRALGDPEVGTAMVLKRDEDFHAAAQNLIEMACDSAVAAHKPVLAHASQRQHVIQEAAQRLREMLGCAAVNIIVIDHDLSSDFAIDGEAVIMSVVAALVRDTADRIDQTIQEHQPWKEGKA